ncbi:putative methyltransferase TARBP1 [Holothuria leucospilota]|uniref:tRNA (guanosine(18)-2'-O)-methyltransferase TARBP1 n=1 Tax=Holothuria leucospilota TaxID=206669 RepID=A0A9Q1CHL7_HOLLE|nr:putative methyltransferase TARBP1 [Holothuria leucospilota]
MASLLIKDLLERKEGNSLNFIKRACIIALELFKNEKHFNEENTKKSFLKQGKESAVCDLLDLISGLSLKTEFKDLKTVQELQSILDVICYPVLSVHWESSTPLLHDGYHEGVKEFHSVCKLTATILLKDFDSEFARVIIGKIRTAVLHCLEDAHSVGTKVGPDQDEGSTTGSSPADTNFTIFSALEILEYLLSLMPQPALSDLVTQGWYSELTANAIDILESGEPVVCARLCSIIMRKGVTSEETVRQVWSKVVSMHRKTLLDNRVSKDARGNIYLVLCSLVDIFLPIGSKQSCFYFDLSFWDIIRQGLLHHQDPLTRKRAVFLLRRTIAVVSSQEKILHINQDTDQSGAGNDGIGLFSWDPKDAEMYLKVWNDFFLLYEALDEVQIHVVQPVLPKWSNLVRAAYRNDSGAVYLHTSWLTILLERSFKHESRTITRWGVEQALRLDTEKLPLMSQGGDKFIFGPLLNVLREDYLYMRSEASSLENCPQSACQFDVLITGILNQLSLEKKKDFLRCLCDSICHLMWGPVPLTLITEILSKLPSCPAWGINQLHGFRELLQSSVAVFPVAFRSCIQMFLTMASLKFVDYATVSLQEFFTLLAALNTPGPLKRGEQIWTQVCCWLNESSYFSNQTPDSSSNETFPKELKMVLKGNDSVLDDDSIIHDVEVKRLALQTLILLDIQNQLRGEEKLLSHSQQSLFDFLTIPLQEVLLTVGSHIYTPTGKADRAVQILTTMVTSILDTSVSFLEDPAAADLSSLLCSSIEEIFTYLKRRLLSMDASKISCVDKVQIYVDFLTAIDRYSFNESHGTSTTVKKIQAEIAKFKHSLMTDNQRVLMESVDPQSPQELFSAYVAMAMVAWRLQHSQGSEDMFKNQELFSRILCLQINSLHKSKQFPGEKKGNTGRLIGTFIGSKWRCIQLFIEAGHVTIEYDTVLRKCIDELSLVPDVHSKLVVDCAAVLVRKLASDSPALCCEALTAAWCSVMDFYRNKGFWHHYIAFVQMTFQIELLSEGQDSQIFETICKFADFILDKGESRLGLVNLVISHICCIWHRLLTDDRYIPAVIKAATNYLDFLKRAVLFGLLRKEGRLREEILVYLSLNERLGSLKDQLRTTSHERDPALVRVSVINLLIRIGEVRSKESQAFLVAFLESLIKEEIAITPKKKCYVINSQVHRIKQRIWQAFLGIVNYIPEEHASHLFQLILAQLANENQSSAKHMMEWLVVLMIHKFPSTIGQFWARLDEMIRESRTGFSPILIIISHLGSVQATKEDKVSLYCKAVPILFPWSMAPTVSLRVQSQVSLYKIWLDCKKEGLTEVLEKFPGLDSSMQYNETRGSAITNKMEGNFFLKDFHPLLDYSMETIFQTLPYLTMVIEDELVLPEMFLQDSPEMWRDGSVTSVPLFNKRSVLKSAAKLGKAAGNSKLVIPGSSVDLNVVDFKEKSVPIGGDVQKKITPLREELAPGLDDSESVREEKRGQLVVVATLVDRMPNLGGLCRTSEIFGVEKLVIGRAQYLEDKSFLGLSVTAEKWLPMKEVRPSELKDYLTEMRHHGYTLVGVEQTANSIVMSEYQFPIKTLLLLGNERTGIPVELIHHLDVCVEIPQLGYIRSLNVHVSGALMIWEYTKQRMLGL